MTCLHHFWFLAVAGEQQCVNHGKPGDSKRWTLHEHKVDSRESSPLEGTVCALSSELAIVGLCGWHYFLSRKADHDDHFQWHDAGTESKVSQVGAARLAGDERHPLIAVKRGIGASAAPDHISRGVASS
ncbi:hypothetical protein GUJ93_ZPchr0004g40361 [Zizania palustris]|uniref:Uncharacterized protein n=1 Tax=Zizania palustris TaxID=103762 RepID=A0A8J5VNF0_ZIZPA|nr:hypothetical protein GUJ93_ZPchr0004g40361 [Zizania palustris]